VIRRLIPAAAAALLLLGAAADRATAASEVRSKLNHAAREIGQLLQDEKQTAVAIGEIAGPPLPKTSAGPMIQSVLVQELKKLKKPKVDIRDDAFVFITGEYFVLDNETKNREDLTVRLVINLKNKSGKKLSELNIDLGYRSNEDLIRLLAINADLEKYPNEVPIDQNKRLRQQLKEQPLKLDSTKIKVSVESPFAVEVLTRPARKGGFKAQTPKARNGHAFVDIKKGEEYVLKLHNSSKFEVAVSISIDGVDVFHFFEPAAGRPTTFLIAPGKTATVEGWMRSTKALNRFLVGSFGDSAAATALKSSSKIGTITVCFSPCWEVGKKPPGDYQPRSLDPRATGIGDKVDIKARVLQRTIGSLAAAISIRYDR
jgi:hypothetical protein